MTTKLAITRLTLTGFRSYDSLRLETHGRSMVLTGANGAGKTNVLEAVSLLAPGRGMRGEGHVHEGLVSVGHLRGEGEHLGDAHPSVASVAHHRCGT